MNSKNNRSVNHLASENSVKRVTKGRISGRRTFLAGVVAASVSVGVTGCQNIVRRGQSPDNQLVALAEEPEQTSRYINDICGIWGLRDKKVEGIGLVRGLGKTGSDPTPSGQREHLLRELQNAEDLERENTLIKSSSTSMVLLKGQQPAGARKGDRFDIQVRTMPNSDTSDLQSGKLLRTRMRPNLVLRKSVRQGHVLGIGEGRVLTDAMFENRKDKANQTRGWILGGGVVLQDRTLGLTIRTDSFSARTTTLISRAINTRFKTVGRDGRTGVAKPKSDKIIELLVPDEYRHNVGRYMQVIVNIAFNEPSIERVNRLDKLDKEISEPSTAAKAAIRLEGIGEEAIPTLKRALRHHDAEVRFYVAQALAYMGEIDGIDILETMAETEPAFRWHALTALASVDAVESGAALSKLMHANSAEARYGAFRAMRARSPRDPVVRGEWVANDFYLHEVDSEASPMVHFSRRDRQEIVCFGRSQTVTDDFLYVEAGLTTKSLGGGKVRVIRFLPGQDEVREVCSNELPDLIRTLASVGCKYTTILEVLRQAKRKESLESQLVINAVPKIGRKYEKVAGELAPEKSEKFVSESEVPELFRGNDDSDAAKARRDDNPFADPEKRESKSKPVWTRMKDWFAN